jgi:hypothetical protein
LAPIPKRAGSAHDLALAGTFRLARNERGALIGCPFYVAGGTLPPNASSYVVRQADTDLLSTLLKGEFCYVLNTRQMGKSSLMIRTAAKLREQGMTVAVLDLTAVGAELCRPNNGTTACSCRSGEQLHLEDELDDSGREHGNLGPRQRFFALSAGMCCLA